MQVRGSLAKDGLAPSSIKSYLSAVRHLHLAMHLPDPKIGEMSRLEQVIKGSKCEYAKHNPGSRERLPISPDPLLKMRKVWEKQAKDHDNIMLWAAACLCFFGFFRAGEITVPSEADIMIQEYTSTSQMLLLTTNITRL